LGGGTTGYELGPVGSDKDSERIFESAVDEVRKARIKNVFISFNINDEAMVNLMRTQAKNKKYDIEFRDYSVKEPFNEKWKTNCRERIAQTSMVICMIGEKTAGREAVNWELEEAYRLGKEVIGVKIYRDKNYPIPKPLRAHNAPIVEWNLKKISKLLDKK